MSPPRASSAADPLAGRVLSHYRIEERLGAGGMGVLYRATDLTLGRFVAVKLLARHLASDENAKARFVQEARAQRARSPKHRQHSRHRRSRWRAVHRHGAVPR